MRNQSYYRDMRRKHIARKKRIIHELNDYWAYEHEGYLSKGKIHCSCGMCCSKTRNKGKRRKVQGNYAPNLNYKHSDEQKIIDMKQQEEDWLDAKIENVSVEGIPLDGHYLDNLINQIDF